jgi:hypothetical protein
MYVGASYITGARFLKDKWDDMRIYNRALSNKQVLALYLLPN